VDAQAGRATPKRGRDRVARVGHPEERTTRDAVLDLGSLGRIVCYPIVDTSQVLDRGDHEMSSIAAIRISPCSPASALYVRAAREGRPTSYQKLEHDQGRTTRSTCPPEDPPLVDRTQSSLSHRSGEPLPRLTVRCKVASWILLEVGKGRCCRTEYRLVIGESSCPCLESGSTSGRRLGDGARTGTNLHNETKTLSRRRHCLRIPPSCLPVLLKVVPGDHWTEDLDNISICLDQI
jgi:hypothetical protein